MGNRGEMHILRCDAKRLRVLQGKMQRHGILGQGFTEDPGSECVKLLPGGPGFIGNAVLTGVRFTCVKTVRSVVFFGLIRLRGRGIAAAAAKGGGD